MEDNCFSSIEWVERLLQSNSFVIIPVHADYALPSVEMHEKFSFDNFLHCVAGLIRQPKYGHLKELHRAVKLCERALVSADPTVTSLGNLQQVFTSAFHHLTSAVFHPYIAKKNVDFFFQAYIYSSEMGGCAAFLSNYDTQSAVRVIFNNRHYNLPPWSISILPDCRNVVFNTAKVCY